MAIWTKIQWYWIAERLPQITLDVGLTCKVDLLDQPGCKGDGISLDMA